MGIKFKNLIKKAVKKSAGPFGAAFRDFIALSSVFVQSDFFCPGIKKIKNKKFGELVVIGNGPSLNETFKDHLGFFFQKALICVNDFAVSEYFGKIKPDFYVLFDSAYWIKAVSANIRLTNEKVFNCLKEKVSWPLTIIMPVDAKEESIFTGLPQLNRNIHICYVNWTRIDCSQRLRNFLYRLNLAMPRCVNVLINAIFLGLNLGYKKIYLVGADHSWHEDVLVGSDNQVYRKGSYFYSDETPNLIPAFKNPDENEKFTMHELFGLMSLTFKGHHEMAEYATFLGAKIFNLSKKSYIDAYERLSLG